MSKYSAEFKLKVIRSYSEECGFRKLAKRFDLDEAAVRKWVHAYESHGDDTLRKKASGYSIEFMLMVLEKISSGKMSIRGVCAHFDIRAHRTVLTWQRLYNEGGIDALQNRPRGRPKMSKQAKPIPESEKPLEEMTREELLQELEYRRAEVAYLKKLKALVQSRQSATKPKH